MSLSNNPSFLRTTSLCDELFETMVAIQEKLDQRRGSMMLNASKLAKSSYRSKNRYIALPK